MSLEAEIAKVVEEIDRQMQSDARFAADVRSRRESFEATDGSNYQCPHCWIVRDQQGFIRPIASDTKGIDRFRCGTCGLNFEVPSPS